MKRTWSKPELIVLHRDTAEAVLAMCKGASTGTGSTTMFPGCNQTAAPCTKCNAQAAS